MALSIVGIGLALILALLMLTKVKLHMGLRLRSRYCEIRLCFHFALGIIRIPMRYCVEYEPFEGIRLMKYVKRGLRQVKVFGCKKKNAKPGDKALLGSLRQAMRVRSVEVTGEIGVLENAFYTVMLAGAIRILIDNALKIGLPLLVDKKPPESTTVSFFPCMSRNAFSLNLEGILEAKPLKLIKNAITAVAKHNKGD